MGFFGKLKKKAGSSEGTSEEEVSLSVSGDISSDSSSSGDDFDTIMADIDAVSIDDAAASSESGVGSPTEEPAKDKAKKAVSDKASANIGLYVKVLGAMFFLLVIIVGLAFTWQWFTRPYLGVQKQAELFFRHLSQRHDRPAWGILSADLQRELKQEEFILALRGSSFYFRDIDLERLDLEEKNFQTRGAQFFLKGKIFYLDNRGEGSFELDFVRMKGQKNKSDFRINQFQIEADTRRDVFHRDAYLFTQEFFKTFASGESLRVAFMSFIHADLKSKKDDYGWIKLHSSLAETGFKKHDWLFEDRVMVSNVELEFRGSSYTELGQALYGRVQAFYDDSDKKWSIIGFDFSSIPFSD